MSAIGGYVNPIDSAVAGGAKLLTELSERPDAHEYPDHIMIINNRNDNQTKDV